MSNASRDAKPKTHPASSKRRLTLASTPKRPQPPDPDDVWVDALIAGAKRSVEKGRLPDLPSPRKP